MQRWLLTAFLFGVLAGCGPSEYEKAQAKAAGAKLLIEEAEDGIASVEAIPVRDRTDDMNQALELWRADIETATAELKDATATLRKLGR